MVPHILHECSCSHHSKPHSMSWCMSRRHILMIHADDYDAMRQEKQQDNADSFNSFRLWFPLAATTYRMLGSRWMGRLVVHLRPQDTVRDQYMCCQMLSMSQDWWHSCRPQQHWAEWGRSQGKRGRRMSFLWYLVGVVQKFSDVASDIVVSLCRLDFNGTDFTRVLVSFLAYELSDDIYGCWNTLSWYVFYRRPTHTQEGIMTTKRKTNIQVWVPFFSFLSVGICWFEVSGDVYGNDKSTLNFYPSKCQKLRFCVELQKHSGSFGGHYLKLRTTI